VLDRLIGGDSQGICFVVKRMLLSCYTQAACMPMASLLDFPTFPKRAVLLKRSVAQPRSRCLQQAEGLVGFGPPRGSVERLII